MKNKAAVALGKLAKGRPKNLSSAEIKRRTERLSKARKLRWKSHEANQRPNRRNDPATPTPIRGSSAAKRKHAEGNGVERDASRGGRKSLLPK